MKNRKKYAIIKNHLTVKEFTILIGARQTGKSTILKQLAEELKKEGRSVVFLNLERKEILLDLNQNPENIYKYCPPVSINDKTFVLIDEIQYLQDPTNFLKLLYDEHAQLLKIIATGSSAFYIDKHFKDSLAGRKKIFELYTLDFEEFLDFKEQKELLNELKYIQKNNLKRSVFENQLFAYLDEYINYGGYPAVVLEPDITSKIERLKEIRDSFVKRDILEAGINDEDKFYRLFIILASQIGNLVNVNELSKTLKITNITIEKYLIILQKCFHIRLIKPFHKNIRKEIVKMPKIYFEDLGLRNIMINYFTTIDQRIDKGELLENYVYRKTANGTDKDSIKFWRTADGTEVDFIIEDYFENGKSIEVKFNKEEAKISKYKKFTEAYPNYPLSFISWNDINLLY
jgi:uncharacterized protein